MQIESIELIVVVVMVPLVAILSWLTWRLLRIGKRCTELSQELIRLQDLIHAQSTAMKGMGSSLGKVRTQQQQVAVQVEQLEQIDPLINDAPTMGGSQVYRQAINLAVDGAEPAELAQRFGFSRGEAELMVSFHQLGEKVA